MNVVPGNYKEITSTSRDNHVFSPEFGRKQGKAKAVHCHGRSSRTRRSSRYSNPSLTVGDCPLGGSGLNGDHGGAEAVIHRRLHPRYRGRHGGTLYSGTLLHAGDGGLEFVDAHLGVVVGASKGQKRGDCGQSSVRGSQATSRA